MSFSIICITVNYNIILDHSNSLIVAYLYETRLSRGGLAKLLQRSCGAMVLDQEVGLRGDLAIHWAQKWGFRFAYKAPRQKAWIVERHNEIIRQGIPETESQTRGPGSIMTSPDWATTRSVETKTAINNSRQVRFLLRMPLL